MTFSLTRKRVVLLCALAFSFVAGAMVPFLPQNGGPAAAAWSGVSSLVLAILVASWCQEDSRSRNIRVGKPTLWLIVLLCPVGLLFYLFRSRQAAQALLAVVMCVVFLALCVAVLIAGVVFGVLVAEMAGWPELP